MITKTLLLYTDTVTYFILHFFDKKAINNIDESTLLFFNH